MCAPLCLEVVSSGCVEVLLVVAQHAARRRVRRIREATTGQGIREAEKDPRPYDRRVRRRRRGWPARRTGSARGRARWGTGTGHAKAKTEDADVAARPRFIVPLSLTEVVVVRARAGRAECG